MAKPTIASLQAELNKVSLERDRARGALKSLYDAEIWDSYRSKGMVLDAMTEAGVEYKSYRPFFYNVTIRGELLAGPDEDLDDLEFYFEDSKGNRVHAVCSNIRVDGYDARNLSIDVEEYNWDD